MNSLWSAAAGSTLQFGAKACNINAVPTLEMQAGRGLNTVQDKGQGVAIFPGHPGKDKSSQATNTVDIAQKKQILLQQSLPHGAPNNLLVWIIFPKFVIVAVISFKGFFSDRRLLLL